MSLASKLDKFRQEQADATKRNLSHSRPASATPARIATPKPTADTSKRSHDSAFAKPSTNAVAFPASGDAGFAGNELLTNVNFAKKYLKEKFPQSKTFDDIIAYLSLPLDADKNKPRIRVALMDDEHIEVIPRGANGNKQLEFRHKPKVPVSTADQLRTFLASRNSADGILVNDIKDGWPDCVPAINKLADEGAVLVTRGKNDEPRYVYADSPNYHISVDNDFRDFWFKGVKLPKTESDLRNELEKAGVTPTSQVKEIKKLDNKKQKKKPIRRGGKTTNTHMTGILKDYNRS